LEEKFKFRCTGFPWHACVSGNAVLR